jgi:catechol 2,3-dioxygenase-like lactoylglutathione lyase family enzyme
MEIDHLAVTCADLEEGVAWVEDALGVRLESGGRHERFGTWNRLLSLGPGCYLEVIAPEPGVQPAGPRWFGLDHAGAPRLGNWIVRVEDMEASLADAPPEAGRALDLSRGPFAWTVAVPTDGSLPWGGAFPTLIRWHEGGHPSDRLQDRGVRLAALEVGHPDAPGLRALLAGLNDPRLTVTEAAAPMLRACFSTPRGEAIL